MTSNESDTTNPIDIDAILDQWEKDCETRVDQLRNHTIDVYKLHAKYLKHFRQIVKVKNTFIQAQEKVVFTRRRYYSGKATEEELAEWKLKPFKYVLKTQKELQDYIDGDPLVRKIKKKVCECDLALDTVKAILKMIENRNYNLKLLHEILMREEGL